MAATVIPLDRHEIGPDRLKRFGIRDRRGLADNGGTMAPKRFDVMGKRVEVITVALEHDDLDPLALRDFQQFVGIGQTDNDIEAEGGSRQ